MTESKIKLTVVTEMIKTCVKDNAASTQSQKKYNRLHNGLLNRYEKVVDRLTELTAEKESKRNQDREIRMFIETLKKTAHCL